jgi:pimeloyl-ACP methyl ester carboxylesterase
LPSPPATKFVDLDDVTVHYLHTGPTTLPDRPPAFERAHPFVLLHAAGSNAGMWRRQLDDLAATHDAVALDMPAHGRSPGVEGPPSIEAMAELVRRFRIALGLRKPILVGRSMGGAVALVTAAREPEAIAGLVLVCTAARFDLLGNAIATSRDVSRGRLPQQFTTETFSPSTSLDLMKVAWMEQVKTDPRVRLGDLLACQAFDGVPLLGRIRVPTLVIGGADDQVTPPERSRELADGIPGARLEILEQAGHQAPLEQQARFRELLVGFAEGLG